MDDEYCPVDVDVAASSDRLLLYSRRFKLTDDVSMEIVGFGRDLALSVRPEIFCRVGASRGSNEGPKSGSHALRMCTPRASSVALAFPRLGVLFLPHEISAFTNITHIFCLPLAKRLHLSSYISDSDALTAVYRLSPTFANSRQHINDAVW